MAQVGCFQYFTGLTGTLQSYNYANLAQIKVIVVMMMMMMMMMII